MGNDESGHRASVSSEPRASRAPTASSLRRRRTAVDADGNGGITVPLSVNVTKAGPVGVAVSVASGKVASEVSVIVANGKVAVEVVAVNRTVDVCVVTAERAASVKVWDAVSSLLLESTNVGVAGGAAVIVRVAETVSSLLPPEGRLVVRTVISVESLGVTVVSCLPLVAEAEPLPNGKVAAEAEIAAVAADPTALITVLEKGPGGKIAVRTDCGIEIDVGSDSIGTEMNGGSSSVGTEIEVGKSSVGTEIDGGRKSVGTEIEIGNALGSDTDGVAGTLVADTDGTVTWLGPGATNGVLGRAGMEDPVGRESVLEV